MNTNQDFTKTTYGEEVEVKKKEDMHLHDAPMKIERFRINENNLIL